MGVDGILKERRRYGSWGEEDGINLGGARRRRWDKDDQNKCLKFSEN